jgi:hypothetical protein
MFNASPNVRGFRVVLVVQDDRLIGAMTEISDFDHQIPVDLFGCEKSFGAPFEMPGTVSLLPRGKEWRWEET